MMAAEDSLIHDLETLNEIVQTLNQSVDMQGALDRSLAKLLDLMGLQTGWVFVVDPLSTDRWGGRGFRLAAHHNLPPGMAITRSEAWDKDCDCQTLCLNGQLTEAYNEVRCSRLSSISGDGHGLTVHASAPLRSGNQVMGILNVAAEDWSAFSPRTLALLSNVGAQMGIAIERSRLFDMTQQRRVHEQMALLDLSQQLLSRRDLDDLMEYIVTEARTLVEADAAALLLAGDDEDHLTFGAASGWLSDPVGDGMRVPADEKTGSGRAMRSQQVQVFEDLETHSPRLWSADWLDVEAFKAAAIVPLVANGHSIGALVIDSRRKRQFSQAELRLLRLMANQAALAIEKARLHRAEVQQQRIEEELAVGRRIQLSMLPDTTPELPGWQFATRFEAAQQVGGDFYDYFPLPGDPPGRWGIGIADVSDTGVPAALFMALSRTTIRNVALRGRSPTEVLTWANRFIQEDSQSDMFLTAFYGALDTNSGQLTYASAGHNPPLWWRAAERDFVQLMPTGPLLGVLEHAEVPEQTIELAPGDALILYTDGVTEAFDADYQEFGLDRMQAVVAAELVADPAVSAETLLTAIGRAQQAFVQETTQFDDTTMFIIKRTEAPNP
jgi:sigma-B regulation protein RsbU (phosphoserine phosphatase)